MPDIDLIVVDRAFAGDEAAACDLVRAISPRLRSFARSLLGPNQDRVDDLVQETLLKMWRIRTDFDRTKASFITWVLMIMRSLHIDEYRKKKRRPPAIALDGAQDSTTNIHPLPGLRGPAQPDDEVTLNTDITRALRALDDTKRALVWLVDRDGYPVTEAAKVIGLSDSNARYHLVCARTTLRQLLRLPDPDHTEVG